MQMESYKFPNKSAWQLIKERFKVSLIFGITGFVLSYIVCIPLGILKALRHDKAFDIISSIIIKTDKEVRKLRLTDYFSIPETIRRAIGMRFKNESAAAVSAATKGMDSILKFFWTGLTGFLGCFCRFS